MLTRANLKRRLTLLAAGVGLLGSNSALLAQPTETSCPAGQTVQRTLASGAAWDMCWQADTAKGIVLSNVYYTTPAGLRRRVLGNAAIAQIQTDYDDGTTASLISSTAGLGGSALLTLNTSQCPDGTLHSTGSREVLCETVRDRGYIYKHPDVQKQGQLLELFGISQLGSRNYVVRWQFYDSGTIDPAIGLSGTLPRTGTNATYGWPVTAENVIGIGFTDHYFWRLDFDLDSTASNDVVEEISALPSPSRLEKFKTVTPISTETARSTDWDTKRFWRIRDGAVSNDRAGHISYELVTLNHAHQSDGNRGESWLASDIFFTRYKSCEQLATQNPTTACGGNVSSYVNGESLSNADVVAWYRLSYHHLPRDEDINRIPLRWNGFELLPRDWSAQNPM